jgi:hypothetical protein
MILPPLQGSLQQSGFFIYAAADSNYFDQFGRALINSVCRNTEFGVHLHLYNPTQEQIDFCQSNPRVSVSWENFEPSQFNDAIEFWSRNDLPEPQAGRKKKMLGMKQIDDNQDVPKWVLKTYYACMRFVRLAELVDQPMTFLEIDVDGLVRAPFQNSFGDNKDFYLYEKEKGGHLAGSILYTATPGGLSFIQELGAVIKKEIENNNTYWFLDQHSIDNIIGKYNKGLLPISYVDWKMNDASAIWSAKGKRKELDVFKRELGKYQ